MRKLILILLCLPLLNFAQQTYIPDDKFEQKLINLGYDNILDDSVLTSSIDTVTYLEFFFDSVVNLTGIEDFNSLTSLTYFGMSLFFPDSVSPLINLDLSQNTALITLVLHAAQLTSLDLSNNTALEYFDCSGNNLTSLDLSQNTALQTLYCNVNQLTSLDLSNNIALTSLSCPYNQLTSLDLRNGNNSNFTFFSSINNPNLLCVDVDEPSYSDTNWNSIDSWTSFSIDCSVAIFGCTDTAACNFDFLATNNDASCDYSCVGCLDSSAFNYDTSYTIADSSCCYAPYGNLQIYTGNQCGFPAASIEWELQDSTGMALASGGANSGEVWEDDTYYDYCVPISDNCVNYSLVFFSNDPFIWMCINPIVLLTSSTGDTLLDVTVIMPFSLVSDSIEYSFSGLEQGCIDPLASNYDPTIQCADSSCCYASSTNLQIYTGHECGIYTSYMGWELQDSTGFVLASGGSYGGETWEDSSYYDYCFLLDDNCTNYNLVFYSSNSCTDPTILLTSSTGDTLLIDSPSYTEYYSITSEIRGCIDPLAFNYDSIAGCDNGSCCFISGCTDFFSDNYNADACFDDGSCSYIYASCFSIANEDQLSETVIGTTTYDLQTNNSVQNRILVHEDGTISAAWTMSAELNSAWIDRGTGYNYFDGNSWGANPNSRLESTRCGWPSILTTGSGKEIVIAHNTDNSYMQMTHRSSKGVGPFSEQIISSLDSAGFYRYLIWNRSVVGGIDNKTIHMVAVTSPSHLGGPSFNGLDGALLYYRSQDEGVTWDIQEMQLSEMDSTMYNAMGSDCYAIATKGETVAVAYFDDFGDSYILKSIDNGDNWIKTTFLDFPVDKYVIDQGLDLDNDGTLDKVYSTDKSGTLIIDDGGNAHVFYGIMMYTDSDLFDGNISWFPDINGGIAYWNESFGADTTSATISIVDSSLWYSDMMKDHLIIQPPDFNGDGIIAGIDGGGYEGANYYGSKASMPSAGIDSLGNIYLSYSAYTENIDNGSQVFRHIYVVKSADNGISWSCPIDVTPNDSLECVFGSMNSIVNDKIRILYQKDSQPGMSVWPDQDDVNLNDIVYLEVSLAVFDSTGVLALGCTDTTATNYDSLANHNDGSCTYIYGCTDINALNYDSSATVNDSSCFYTYIYGCTDANALNYDSSANMDNGSCISLCTLYDIYISEVHGSGFPEDYIEIINHSNKACSMKGWMLDDTQYFNDLTFTEDAIIPPGGFWLGIEDSILSSLHDSSGNIISFLNYSFNSGISSSGEDIYLSDGTNIIHRSIMMTPDQSNMNAQNLDSTGFICYALPSPGSLNSSCYISGCQDSIALNYNSNAVISDTCIYDVIGCTSLEIIISEAQNKPTDYIEIKNISNISCNMVGWKIDDSDNFNDWVFPLAEIPAGGFWYGIEDASNSGVYDSLGIFLDTVQGSFSSGLNKNGDNVWLTNTSDTIHVVISSYIDSLSQSFDNYGIGCYTYPSPSTPNTPCVIFGCTNLDSPNYNQFSTADDSTCIDCDLTFFQFVVLPASSQDCDGFAFVFVQSSNGSTETMSYNWSNGVTGQYSDNLCAGNYTLTITDSSGCMIDTTFNIVSSGCSGDPITGLFIDGIIDDRVTANFDNMNTYDASGNQICRVDQLRIKYREIGTNSWSQKNIGSPTGYGPVTGICNSTQKTDKIIYNLSAGTTYEWQMKVWYCDQGGTPWVNGPDFTTAGECPNVGNFTAYGANPTKATFNWQPSNGLYEFVRIKMRVDSISNPQTSDWFNVGGVGVPYGTFTKNKNGLTPGETYKGQARTWCDPNGGAYNALSWTAPPIVWTQPTNRIDGGEAIKNLDIYPNPSRDVFNITFTSESIQDLRVVVRNVIGEELIVEDLQQFVGEYTKQINLKDNAKGIYLLEIETNEGVINKKLILQ